SAGGSAVNRETTPSFTGVRELVRRRAPGLLDRLHLARSPSGATGTDQVLVGASGGELSIEASSPSAAAVGLAHALETLAGADLSWDGAPLIEVPDPLPDLAPQRLETALHLRYLGLDREAAARFVGGPAFLPWTTMGITHDVGAALTDEALEARARLGRRIADRERELGMTVVLPGFGGQLSAELAGSERTIE